MISVQGLVLLVLIHLCIGENEWNLPVFPQVIPSSKLGKPTTEKLIPRHLWMAVRDKNSTLGSHTKGLIERNPEWQVHICSNDMKDEFMNSTFAGTSFLWAYHIINPAIGAAKADLWRYAVLWTYGGVYIDDDSDIRAPLEKVVTPTDSLIVSYEKNGFNGNRCYIPTHKLSDFQAYKDDKLRDLHLFEDRVLLNWAMMAAPRHPIISQTMINAVEIIRAEYLRESVMRNLVFEHRWADVMCATGPSLLTASAREVIFNENITTSARTTSYDMTNYPAGTRIPYTLAYNDFKEFGGKFKAFAKPVKKDDDHYMNKMKNRKFTLLASYQPEKPVTEEQLRAWQGHAIQGQNGKEIFVVDNLKKRGIPNYDTFLANFTMADVIVIADHKIHSIATGPPMPAVSG